MSSLPVVIDQPVHTPADEWAKDTADALQPAPSAHQNAKVLLPISTVSTPGVEVPGAYPRDAVEELADDSPYKIQDTVGQGIETAKQYLPAQETVNQHLETAKSYIPAQTDVQRALGTAAETAKQYLPESVVAAVGSVLPQGLTSANGTTPPVDAANNLDVSNASRPNFQASTSSVYSAQPANAESATTPSQVTTPSGVFGGNSEVAVGGVAMSLDSSKPPEPRISTSNIQDPYADVQKPEVSVSTSNIQEPYGDPASRVDSQVGSAPAVPDAAPELPPKPDNEAELVGRGTTNEAAGINTEPTQDHIYSDGGLQAPPSVATNKVGGNQSVTPASHERKSSLGSEASDDSTNGKEGDSPKKGRGSRLLAKVKEKLHKGN